MIAVDNAKQKTLQTRLVEEKQLLLDVWQAMRLRLCDTGIEDALNLIPRPDMAKFSLQQDPFDQSESLIGVWHDNHGVKTGEIQIRADGSVYAEVDVIRNHPNDVRWFVEAVTAWGNCSSLKTELRLLPAV